MGAPLVFLDTETTGVHSDRKVWEVAMIRREDAGERECSFMVEVNLEHADPFGLRVGRFYERHPLGRWLSGPTGPTTAPAPAPDGSSYRNLADTAATVARWTHGAHVVGAVPNFDTEVLDAALRWQSLTPAWHYHLIDVEALAVGYLHGGAAHGHSEVTCGPRCGYPGSGGTDALPSLPWDSEALSSACGVEPPGEGERHTALGDARWALRLYDAITGGSA